jgi:hypothetical protein
MGIELILVVLGLIVVVGIIAGVKRGKRTPPPSPTNER